MAEREDRRGPVRGRRQAAPGTPAGRGHLHPRLRGGRVRRAQRRARHDRRLDQAERHREGRRRTSASSSTPPSAASATTSSGSRRSREGGKARIQELSLKALTGSCAAVAVLGQLRRFSWPVAAQRYCRCSRALQSAHEPVEQLRVGDAVGLEQLRVDARGGEPRDRVELVHQHPVVLHEEVHPRHARSSRRS